MTSPTPCRSPRAARDPRAAAMRCLVPCLPLGFAAALAGCAQPQGKPLPADAFLARREVNDRSRVQPVDQGGPLLYDSPGNSAAERPGPPDPTASPSDTPDSGEVVSPTVKKAVRPVSEEGFQLPDQDLAGRGSPTTRPAPAPSDAPVPSDATAPAPPTPPVAQGAPEPAPSPSPSPAPAPRPPDSTGGYQLVGTVLADVESEPIFADKVLAVLDSALAAEARRLDENQFRRSAADLIRKQVHEYIYNALEFAMARSRLDPRDQQLAKGAAIKWREEQITQAGGSEERARQAWAARGFDFEDRVDEQYRTFMRQLYYQRKEAPKIQIGAADLRRYYQENQRTEFTQAERAKFRVIAIDKARRGGRDRAFGDANVLLDRARSGSAAATGGSTAPATGGGKDFAQLASEENDRNNFKTSAGWIPKGSFVIPEVEEAAWKLKPGQIGDIIETPDAFYLVKLEELEGGKVRQFGDRKVQAEIEATLRERQFRALRQRVQQQLIQDAIIRYHPDEPGMLQTAVEMAAQKYRYWRTAAR